MNAIVLTGCGIKGETPSDNSTSQNTTSVAAENEDYDSEGERSPSDPDEDIPDEIDGVRVRQVSLNGYCSAAVTTDGSLYMWGSNDSGQLGNGTTEGSSTPVKIMDNAAYVSLGNSHSAAITTDGSLYMWGSNSSGQLGNDVSGGDGFQYDEGIDRSLPVKIMDNAAYVSLGGGSSAAITTDGSLYTWGSNWFGVLGNGTDEDSSVPLKIMENVAYVNLGRFHSAAITTDGSLYMWGNNSDGQLGTVQRRTVLSL